MLRLEGIKAHRAPNSWRGSRIHTHMVEVVCGATSDLVLELVKR